MLQRPFAVVFDLEKVRQGFLLSSLVNTIMREEFLRLIPTKNTVLRFFVPHSRVKKCEDSSEI